jgi:plasmid stability protein
MTQILVRNIEQSVKMQLQLRKRHPRSMEQEERKILRNAAYEPERSAVAWALRSHRCLPARDLNSKAKEWRGYPVHPITFDESEE